MAILDSVRKGLPVQPQPNAGNGRVVGELAPDSPPAPRS
jgi:hypothetical protein